MGAGWYIENEGSEVVGPLSTERLTEGVRQGRVPLTSRVCPVGGSEWTPLVAAREFADVVRQVAPPPPVPPATQVAANPPQTVPQPVQAPAGQPFPYGAQPLPSGSAYSAPLNYGPPQYGGPGMGAPFPQPALAPEKGIDVAGVISIVLVLIAAAIGAASLSAVFWAVAACALFVYEDARKNGIRKTPQSSSAVNMSPVGWMWLVFLFAVIGLPVYFATRGRLRTRQGGEAFFVLAIISSVVLLLWIMLSIFVGSGSRSVGTGTSIPMVTPQQFVQPDLPSCGAPEVTALLKQVIEERPINRARGVTVLDTGTPGEVRFASASQKRTCRTSIRSRLGTETMFYSVEWQNRGLGLIWLQLLGNTDPGG